MFNALTADLKRSAKLFMDETRAPVLDTGKRKTKTGHFWALARDGRPRAGAVSPGVASTYAPGRSGQWADDILKGFSDILQVDGYSGYNRLLKYADNCAALARGLGARATQTARSRAVWHRRHRALARSAQLHR